MSPRVVVYVGNFTRSWCTEVHVAYALKLAGHLVIETQENALDFADLPGLVYKNKAEMVLWTRTWHVDNRKARAALAELREAGVPVVSFHLDRFHGLDREAQIAEEPFFATDLLFTPDDGPWKSYGVEHVWMPPGVHGPELHGVPDPRRWPFDAVFVGSHPYPHVEWRPVRNALIETFERAFGKRFAVLPGKGNPALRGKDLASLYATVPVVVGDSCLVGNPARYWSDRIPETIGRGGYLLHPTVEGLDEWYVAGEHLDTYTAGAPEQALELARMALDGAEGSERAATIRAAGKAQVIERDTYLHRMKTLMAEVEARFTLRKPEPRSMTVAVRWTGQRNARRPVTATLEVPPVESVHEAVREVWEVDEYGLDPGRIAGKVVLDIGANIGSLTVLAGKVGAAWTVAYEPDPRNADVLERNVRTNMLGGRTVIHRKAVLGSPGVVTLAGEGGGTNVHRVAGHDEEGTTVEAYDINAVIDGAATLGPIALLKLDVEGAEYDIIGGLDLARLRLVDELVMEFHGPEMPHLRHLADEAPIFYGVSSFESLWGEMVAKLADAGRVETFGHPRRGGIIRWKRY